MTKQIMVGGVAVGGGAPVTIQSMCNTKTEDAGATIEQILRLEQAGCEIVRVTVPTPEAAEAVEIIIYFFTGQKVPYLEKIMDRIS